MADSVVREDRPTPAQDWPLDLPLAFRLADSASLDAQTRFLRSTGLQLLLLVLAGSLGAVTWREGRLEIAALLAGVAFLAAASLRFLLLRLIPHRRWYEGRAVAESIKTLSWRYAVGGHPFPIEAADVRGTFGAQARDVFQQPATFDAPSDEDLFIPTPSMDKLRRSGMENRRDAYRRGRIRDQFEWYTRKTEWNRARARFWSGVVLTLQVVAAVGAFLTGLGVIGLDLFGLAAAVVAAAAAWLETKQYAGLASAYRVAAYELARIESLAGEVEKEDWPRFVADAEEAISREHTMWKAKSADIRPVPLA